MATYKPKSFKVEAIRLVSDLYTTSEVIGKAGQWLVVHDTGKQEFIDDDQFKATFEPDIAYAKITAGGPASNWQPR